MAIKKYSPSNNVMPSAVAETKELNGITVTCDGNGTYTVSGTATAYTEISFTIPEFTIPISVGQGGNGTLSFFNTLYNSNNKIVIKFMNGDTTVDSWSLNTQNRTHTSYSTLGGKLCNKIALTATTGMVCNGEFAIMFTNDGQLPSEFVPHLIFKDWFYRKYGTETDTFTSLPADIIGDGQSASADIIGNMNQQGTPSPSSIIMPDECGNKTANLFDYTAATLGKYINASGQEVESSGSVTASKLNHTDYITIQSETNYNIRAESTGTNTGAFCWFDSSKTLLSRQTFNIPSGNYTQTAESPSGAAYMIINYITSNQETVMVNIGSTALPYEPYGYKIPILCGNTTTPVYLGEVQSERKIYEFVLTGNESFNTTTGGYYLADLPVNYLRAQEQNLAICSHYPTYEQVQTMSGVPEGYVSFSYDTLPRLYFKTSDYSTLTDFKTYLQQQYSAGTPVCVWYVLATPQTTTLNEPIRKIGDYADSVSVTGIPTTGTAEQFDVDTTLKPSEVDLTYHGWHEHSDTKFTT